jgi:hypothetical protein
MFRTAFKNDEIEFLCAEEDYGIIPTPYPSKKNIPDWFKALPMKLGNQGLGTSTIKRCSPFLDALSVGYIIPLAADVEFVSNSDGSGVDFKWMFHKNMVETHNPKQISSEKCPNPSDPRPPMKFLNWWMIKTPPEYSLLFLPPLNRVEDRFVCYSGIVDHPYFQYEYVNFPFIFTKNDFRGVVEAGTPLMQVIPIRKDSLLSTHRCRPVSEEDKKNTGWMRKMKTLVNQSVYRNHIHRKL